MTDDMYYLGRHTTTAQQPLKIALGAIYGLKTYSQDKALSTKKVAVFVFPAAVELVRPQV
jgi:hypothetical protein